LRKERALPRRVVLRTNKGDLTMGDQEARSFAPNTASANRAQQQGLGVGHEEMDAQQAPSGDAPVADPQRAPPFDEDLVQTTGIEATEDGAAQASLSLSENPQEDWGGEVEPGAVYSSNHTRRPERAEAERAQGAKTRQATKDMISRRT